MARYVNPLCCRAQLGENECFAGNHKIAVCQCGHEQGHADSNLEAKMGLYWTKIRCFCDGIFIMPYVQILVDTDRKVASCRHNETTTTM